MLQKAMIAHIEGNNLLNDAQHGFQNQWSAISQILCFHNSILMLLEEGQAVNAIYLNFSRAFDKVDHTILLKKIWEREHHWKDMDLNHRVLEQPCTEGQNQFSSVQLQGRITCTPRLHSRPPSLLINDQRHWQRYFECNGWNFHRQHTIMESFSRRCRDFARGTQQDLQLGWPKQQKL